MFYSLNFLEGFLVLKSLIFTKGLQGILMNVVTPEICNNQLKGKARAQFLNFLFSIGMTID